jgi:N-acetylglutamate synthase
VSAPVRTMHAGDYPEVVALWLASEGVGLTESTSAEGVAAFLARNPGMSAVACDAAGRIVGAAGWARPEWFVMQKPVAPGE